MSDNEHNDNEQNDNHIEHEEKNTTFVDPTPDFPPGEKSVLPVQNPIADWEFFGIENVLETNPLCELREMTFEEYNESIENPKYRIYAPCEFTKDLVDCRMGKIIKGEYINDDGETGTNSLFRIYNASVERISKRSFDENSGKSLIITSPAMHSTTGFCEKLVKGKLLKSIKTFVDLNNPHHRQFYIVVNDIIRQCAENLLTAPPTFGLKCPTYPKDQVTRPPSFQNDLQKAIESLADIFRLPKKSETEIDFQSSKRVLYINPFKMKATADKEAREMEVYLPGSRKSISLDALEHICMGYCKHNGEIVKGRPKGFEFSIELLFTKTIKTSKTSIQVKGLKLFIHRLYPNDWVQSVPKHLLTLEGRIDDDFERYMGLDNIGEQPEKKKEDVSKIQNKFKQKVSESPKEKEVEQVEELPEFNNEGVVQKEVEEETKPTVKTVKTMGLSGFKSLKNKASNA